MATSQKKTVMCWLDDLNIDHSQSNYEEFFASVDGLAMGRGTYDFIFDYGSWPYGDLLTWVLSSGDVQSLSGAQLCVIETVQELVADAKVKGLEHIWLVGGGQIASAMLDLGILTNLSISKMPIELGSGIPLFSRHQLNDLECVESTIAEMPGYQQIEIQLAS